MGYTVIIFHRAIKLMDRFYLPCLTHSSVLKRKRTTRTPFIPFEIRFYRFHYNHGIDFLRTTRSVCRQNHAPVVGFKLFNARFFASFRYRGFLPQSVPSNLKKTGKIFTVAPAHGIRGGDRDIEFTKRQFRQRRPIPVFFYASTFSRWVIRVWSRIPFLHGLILLDRDLCVANLID